MDRKQYKLQFLPMFEEDMNKIVDYICFQLRNPIAARDFVNAVQTAIRERQSCAESFEPYHSPHERRYPYYRIPVKNYTIFYVVMGDVMEIRRIVYSRSNYQKMI